MDARSGKTNSSWPTPEGLRGGSPLSKDIETDICVIGAGISGLTSAYFLAKEGRKVILLESADTACAGETSRTTAQLSNEMDYGYAEIVRLHGERGARLAGESHGAAIDMMEQIARDEGIECHFRRLDGYLFLGRGQKRSELEDEFDAVKRAGLQGVEWMEQGAPLPNWNSGPCIRFSRQGQFNPTLYIAGLKAAVERLGVTIHTGTHVLDVGGKDPCEVKTKTGQTVRCQAAVVATNTPITNRYTIHNKQFAYRTFIVAFRIPKDAIPLAHYWDMEEPYHYARLQLCPDDSQDLLLVGGEDHKTGQDDHSGEKQFQALIEWTRPRFPAAGEVAYQWSGQVFQTPDGLAHIGKAPGGHGNAYIITGDCGMGTTHGTLGARILTDLIQGRHNPWADLYDPSRKNISGTRTYLKENANVLAAYADWVKPGDVKDASEIAPNSGAVIRRGTRMVAVYRDASGALTELSAMCPHLWGVVHWNPGEQSWDCPCHGSRFKATGEVICGPAVSNLSPAEK